MYIQFAQIYEVFTHLAFLKDSNLEIRGSGLGLIACSSAETLSLHQSPPSPPRLLEMTREDAVPGAWEAWRVPRVLPWEPVPTAHQ